MITFKELRLGGVDACGYIPQFLSLLDPRPAKEQIHSAYVSGWLPTTGFSLNVRTMVLRYPSDPAMRPYAVAELREELIYIYPSAWVLILQKDGSWEVARID